MSPLLEYGLLIWYLVVFLNALAWLLTWPAGQKKVATTKSEEGVSVVVCARNAGHLLSDQIPQLLRQEYPHWELIILDDHSTDNSWSILQEWQVNPRISTYSMGTEKIRPGKKYAQQFGIAKAQYNWILVTDADCHPASNHWIQCMMQARGPETLLVLGVGLLQRRPGLLNRFIRYEMTHTAIQYLSAAYWKTPYMGVGRNLLFNRHLFESTKHRAGDHLPYGDDDLFVNAASSHATGYCIDPAGFTFSPAKKTLSAYLDQKKRHLSTGKYYHFLHQILLGSWAVLHFLYWLGLFVLCPFYPAEVVVVGTLRMALCMVVFARWTSALVQPDLRWWFPLLDLFFLSIYGWGFRFIFWRDKSGW
ncbi:MAG: glycosyltransferase [Bacteroidota bacterium]